jgi:S1-C subfamily serine protease
MTGIEDRDSALESSEGISKVPGPVTTLYRAGPRRVGIGVAAAALVIAISAAVIAGVAFFSSSGDELSASLTQASEMSPRETVTDAGKSRESDAMVPPDSIPALIDQVSESVVWLECPAGGGTGWVIDTAAEPNIRPAFRDAYKPEGMVLVVTAEHVVRSCVKKKEDPDVYVGERPVGATLLNWRKKTDIALLAIKADLPGLTTTVLTPQAAWAMSVGFPWEFEETVPLIGHVIDDDLTGLWLHMVVQPGSSGSPVVNSQGKAMGTVIASLVHEGEDYSVGWTSAVPIYSLCEEMFLCDEVSVTQRSDIASTIE